MCASLLWLTLHVVLVFVTQPVSSQRERTDARRSAELPESHSHSKPEWKDCQHPYQRPWPFMDSFGILVEQDSFSCGDGFCKCDNRYADCSRQFGNLTYIPALPPDIVFLNFSQNHLESIDDRTFFLNVTNVSGIDLSENDLFHLSLNAFELLWNLTTLLLKCNPKLNYATLVPVFSVVTLEQLYVSDGNLGPPPDLFTKYSMPELRILDLSQNKIRFLDVSAFQPLRKLRQLGVWSSGISNIRASIRVHIEQLDLSVNLLSEFPETCDKKSLFPFLVFFNLSSNKIHSMPQRICMPKLEVLDLSANQLLVLNSHAYRVQLFPSLKVLLLDRMTRGHLKIRSHALTSQTVQEISLENSGIDFGAEVIDRDAFAGCGNLKILRLNGNNVSGTSEEKLQHLFADLSSLERLELRHAGMTGVSSDTFKALQRLKCLDLSENEMTNIPDGAFDSFISLETLDLSSNEVQVVSERTFGPGSRRRLVGLDLSGNPFLCSQDLTWFCHWLSTDEDLFSISRNGYYCSNRQDTNVTSICSDARLPSLSVHIAGYVSVAVGVGLSLLLHKVLLPAAL